MIEYYIFSLPCILAAVVSFNNKIDRVFRLLFLFFIVFYVLIVGLRFGSVDYFNYEDIYYKTSISDFSFPFFDSNSGTTGNEFIYATATVVFKYFGLPFQVFLFFVALVSISLKFYIFKTYSKYFALSVLVYLSFNFTKDLGQIRNALSAGIILMSIIFISSRRPLGFYFSIFIASGIQIFAITALPLYIIHNNRFRFHILIVGLTVAMALPIIGGVMPFLIKFLEQLSGPVISKVIGYYNNSQSIDGVDPYGVGNIFRLFMILWLLCFFRKDLKRNPFSDASLTVLCYGVLLYTLLYSVSIFSYRANEAFSSLTLAIVLPFFVASINKYFRMPVYFVAVSYCLFYMYIAFKVNVMPYQNALFL